MLKTIAQNLMAFNDIYAGSDCNVFLNLES